MLLIVLHIDVHPTPHGEEVGQEQRCEAGEELPSRWLRQTHHLLPVLMRDEYSPESHPCFHLDKNST